MMGGFSDDDIQTVREKINIVDVIGEKVRLKKSGRTFKGLCPFHNEKSPSFHVDPAKQLYHCFGCSAGGDVYSFLMAVEGLDFGEAVEALARQAGHTLQRQSSRQDGRKTRLLKVCAEAVTFYQKVLGTSHGGAAREYLERRNLTELAAEFRLGYSPDWSGVVKYLQNREISDADILEAGIAARSDKGTVYDRLKGRVIFPILDNQGRPIAFGGRVLDDSKPKYINSPETPLYHKGSILYGLSQAKNAFLQADTAIVVEGYTDLLALAGANVRNVVATLGTAFTQDHLRILSRFVGRIVLVFDGDDAGLKAAERSSEYINIQRLPGREALKGLVESIDTEIRVAVMPEALDPADFLAENGVAAFSGLVAEAQPLGLFLIDRIIERHGTDRSGKAKAAAEGGRLVATLSSAVAKEEYLRYLGERLDVSFEALVEETKRVRRSGGREEPPISTGRAPASPERELIKLVLKWPDKAAALEGAEMDAWPDVQLRQLGTVLKDLAGGKGENIKNVLHEIDPELRSLVSELSLEPENDSEIEDYFTQIYIKCKEKALDRRINGLKKQLEATDSTKEKYDALFEELVALEYKRRDLRSHVADGGSQWVRN